MMMGSVSSAGRELLPAWHGEEVFPINSPMSCCCCTMFNEEQAKQNELRIIIRFSYIVATTTKLA